MGEMDALPIPSHVDANPETGASHCCGHNAQLTAIMGAALALTDPEVKAALGGNVTFFAVPAEEFVELELKDKMREDGVIRYGGGKCELIRIGRARQHRPGRGTPLGYAASDFRDQRLLQRLCQQDDHL